MNASDLYLHLNAQVNARHGNPQDPAPLWGGPFPLLVPSLVQDEDNRSWSLELMPSDAVESPVVAAFTIGMRTRPIVGLISDDRAMPHFSGSAEDAQHAGELRSYFRSDRAEFWITRIGESLFERVPVLSVDLIAPDQTLDSFAIDPDLDSVFVSPDGVPLPVLMPAARLIVRTQADFDGDGRLGDGDVVLFLQLMAAQDLAGDLNADGLVDVEDFRLLMAWLNRPVLELELDWDNMIPIGRYSTRLYGIAEGDIVPGEGAKSDSTQVQRPNAVQGPMPVGSNAGSDGAPDSAGQGENVGEPQAAVAGAGSRSSRLNARVEQSRTSPPRIDFVDPVPGDWVVDQVGVQTIEIGFDQPVLVP
ncbi:MAG: hypothetical protein ACNA8P_13595, partial [Phycisphaerales bacterium]